MSSNVVLTGELNCKSAIDRPSDYWAGGELAFRCSGDGVVWPPRAFRIARETSEPVRIPHVRTAPLSCRVTVRERSDSRCF